MAETFALETYVRQGVDAGLKQIFEDEHDNIVRNLVAEELVKRPTQARTRRAARHGASDVQQRNNLDATDELVHLRTAQVETERALRASLQEMQIRIQTCIHEMQVAFQQCNSRVRTYVCCLVLVKRRNGTCGLRMQRTTAEEMNRKPAEGTYVAYVSSLDHCLTFEHFSKWARAQGLRKRRGWYTVPDTNKMDEYLVKPVYVGYSETRSWYLIL